MTALPGFSPGTFTVSWSGQDNVGGSGLASYSIYVSDNGGSFTPLISNTTTTSISFTGTDGHTYGFYSVATDNVGNVQPTPGSAQATTKVDTTPPTSSVTALPGFSPGTFTVYWSGQDNVGGSGLASYTIYVSDNGGSFTPLISNTTTTSISFTGSDGHTYGFYSIATDNVGNVQPTPGSAQATTKVDATPPTSTVTALPGFSPGTFTVTCYGQDNTGGYELESYTVYYSDNGGAYQTLVSNTTTTSTSFTGLDGHTYGFYSIATDNVGNVQPTPGSAQTTTKVDTTPPTSSITALPGFSSGTFTVSWSGQDNVGGSGLASYSIYVSDNGGSFAPLISNTTTTSISFTGSDSHTYGFYSIATDNVGNVQPTPGSAQATTKVDATPPTSTVTALPGFSPGTFTLSWSGQDNVGGSGIASYSIYVSDNGGDFTPLISNTTTTSISFTGTDSHTYGFYSIATDNVGNVQATPGSAQATTKVDATPPTSTVGALPGFSQGTFIVSWSGQDNTGGSGLAYYSIYDSDNGGAYQLLVSHTTTTSTAFTGQNGHTYGFYSIATDNVGNVQSTPGSAQATTTVDTIPPTSTVAALSSFSPGTFTVSWSGQDNTGGSGLASYTIYYSDNGGAYQTLVSNTTTTTSSFTGTNGHTYGFISIATDNAGNIQTIPGSAQATTKVDTIPPTSSVTALPGFSPGTFRVSWSGQDNAGGSGVASYSVYVSDNGGSFVPLVSNTSQTSAFFTGSDGHTYGFYSVATDEVGNVQPTPSSAQATTKVDATPPTSTVTALPAFSPGTFTVTWSGQDNPGGSGLASYSVYYADNGGTYVPLVTNTTTTSKTFTGSDSHTYSFYCIATDNVGNVQATPSAPQATTKVDTTPPTSSVNVLPSFSPGTFTLSWSGQDTVGGSGVASYTIYYSDNGGSYQALVTNTAATSRSFTGQNGHTYSFYSIATDNVGNVQPNPGFAQATTKVDSVPPTSSVAVLANFSPGTFTLSWSGQDNSGGSGLASYTVYVSDNAGAYQPLISNTTTTALAFTGTDGHTYGFYSLATDNVGNVQPTPSSGAGDDEGGRDAADEQRDGTGELLSGYVHAVLDGPGQQRRLGTGDVLGLRLGQRRDVSAVGE